MIFLLFSLLALLAAIVLFDSRSDMSSATRWWWHVYEAGEPVLDSRGRPLLVRYNQRRRAFAVAPSNSASFTVKPAFFSSSNPNKISAVFVFGKHRAYPAVGFVSSGRIEWKGVHNSHVSQTWIAGDSSP